MDMTILMDMTMGMIGRTILLLAIGRETVKQPLSPPMIPCLTWTGSRMTGSMMLRIPTERT